jgi:hypothetical protein
MTITCPHCEEEIDVDFSYDPADPSVGIMEGTFYPEIDSCPIDHHVYTNEEYKIITSRIEEACKENEDGGDWDTIEERNGLR